MELKKKIYIFSSLSIILWGIFSYFFYYFYQELKIFITMDADYLIQLFEVQYYRGKELVPYLIIYFVLNSISFLLIFTIGRLLIKKNYSRKTFLVFLILIILFNVMNLMNRLFPFFIILLIISTACVYGVVTIIGIIYVDEVNEIIYTIGNFQTEIELETQLDEILGKLTNEYPSNKYSLIPEIYFDKKKKYCVDVYISRHPQSQI